jgi:hypothetical protein
MLDEVRDKGVTDITTVFLAFVMVSFDDGTAWRQGIELREAPNAPGNWSTVGPAKPFTY